MNKLYSIAVLLLIGFLLVTCDMGLGPSIDLEPPVLGLTKIVLPNGEEIIIEGEDNKLLIGPGILVGPGITLYGTARDNVRVDEIAVEETGDNAELIDGQPPRWSTRDVSEKTMLSASSRQGERQTWSIELTGLKKGIRTITITAFDRHQNIGPDSVKQLTLLVDTDPPFVDNVKIERQPGLQVDLLPKAKLEELDPYLFENIDYFQNEQFSIRAAVDHDFSLVGVTLNLAYWDENDELINVFEDDLERASGSIYAPVWFITHEMIVAANPDYAAGRHYLFVTITAKAEAGHRSENLLNALCWYPEADDPRITIPAGPLQVEMGGVILADIFDDDNVGDVYAAMITAQCWNGFMSGASDDEKLQWLITGDNKDEFTDEKGRHPLQPSVLASPIRSTVIPVQAGDVRGEHKVVVLVKDQKRDTDKPAVWTYQIADAVVIEEGIPVITVESPQDNTSPALADGKFSVTGSVLDINELNLLRMAWIPASVSAGWDTDRQLREGEQALLSGGGTNGIKVWDLSLSEPVPTAIGGKSFVRQSFSHSLDIFTDFMVNDVIDNDPKFLMLYTQGKSGFDVFQTLRLMPYTKPPVIEIDSPINWWDYAPNSDIVFEIRSFSELGVPIVSVELRDMNDQQITLAKDGDIWKATIKENSMGERSYQITAKDILGNEAEREVYVRVTTLPKLAGIDVPHNSGVVFSGRDTIIVEAIFDGAVEAVDITHGRPRIKLEGFTDGTPRYANYSGGVGSTTLEFSYAVQSGDATGTLLDSLRVTELDMNGGGINADSDAMDVTKVPFPKIVYVDGVSPRISAIAFAAKDADGDYAPWLREGAAIEIRVTANKDILVLGTPKLRLQFDNGAVKEAGLLNVENRVMIFNYKIQPNDEAEPVTIDQAACFSDADMQLIIDKTGTEGNGNYFTLTGTVTPAGEIKVDAVPPAKLTTDEVTPLTGELKRLRIKAAETGGSIESDAVVKYTRDGLDWLPDTGSLLSPYEFALTEPNIYQIGAKQIDRAGNESEIDLRPLDLVNSCDLSAVICTNSNGAYNSMATLTFRLVFTGRVYTTGSGASGPSITINGGDAPGNTNDITIYLGTTVTESNAAFALNFTWPVEEGRRINPVQIEDINLNGILRAGEGTPPGANDKNALINDNLIGFNKIRDIKVLSVRPTATMTVPSSGLTATGDKSILTLTFSHNVWPESGAVTVRPAGGWYIPPVLGNDEYSTAYNATAQQAVLTGNYTETTYGLLVGQDDSGDDVYVPDTATKYVLRFDTGVTANGVTAHDDRVRAVREALNSAKYLWQEIEVVSEDQVTDEDGNPITIDSFGETIVKIHLDKLADGRQWKVEIPEGAFRDEAGNPSVAWAATTSEEIHTFSAAAGNTFWSEKTASPVIRVNRVSNNSVTIDPTTNTDNITATPANKGTANEQISRVNVEYRIDCETPEATIQYNTWLRTSAEITNTMVEKNIYSPDGTKNIKGPQAANSNLTDAKVTELTSNAYLNPNKPYSLTDETEAGDYRTIGDTSLYTARKDYIGAQATHTALGASDRAYEGAFKTLIVYRDAPTSAGKPYVKLEATNTASGAVTISGFPMNYNDMSGRKSKYAYHNLDTDDWIWISWEIVSDFWHVGMAMVSNTPNSAFTQQQDPWQPFGQDHQDHNYRKYGNYGLRIGN